MKQLTFKLLAAIGIITLGSGCKKENNGAEFFTNNLVNDL